MLTLKGHSLDQCCDALYTGLVRGDVLAQRGLLPLYLPLCLVDLCVTNVGRTHGTGNVLVCSSSRLGDMSCHRRTRNGATEARLGRASYLEDVLVEQLH